MPATKRITAAEYLARPYPEERRWIPLVEGERVVGLLGGFEPPLPELFRAIE